MGRTGLISRISREVKTNINKVMNPKSKKQKGFIVKKHKKVSYEKGVANIEKTISKIKKKAKQKYTKRKGITYGRPKKTKITKQTEPIKVRSRKRKSSPEPIIKVRSGGYTPMIQHEDRILMALSQELDLHGKGISKAIEAGTLDKRISFSKLQYAYSVDEVAFRNVNFYAEKVVGPRFDLVGDEEAVKVLWKFIDHSEMFIKLEGVVRDMCISGNSYWEFLKSGRSIGGIKRLDFRFIDYRRNSDQRVILDAKNVYPVGYIFGRIPFTNSQSLFSEVEYSPQELIHFKLYSSGNDLAYGYVEPAYGLITYKRNIWVGLAKAAYNIGHRPLIIKHGDPPNPSANYPGHKPTQKEIDQTDSEFQDIESKNIFTVPYWIDIKQLEASMGEAQTELITKCNIGIAIAFGLPPEMVGETKGNKAIIDTLITRDVNESIKAIQNKLSVKLRTELFPLILAQNHISAEVPEIRWNEIAPPDKNRMAKRLNDYVGSGILRPEDVREMVLKSEGLKVNEEDLKEIRKRGTEILDMIRDGGITVQEAIVFLQNLKKSFPDSEAEILIDKLIEKIMSKDTAPEKPKEVNNGNGRDESAGNTMENAD